MNISCLNVCGLKSKLKFPDFHDLIKQYDIFVCTESKSDNLDVFDVPSGYDYMCKHRTKCDKKSGGITIIFKSSLKGHLTFVKSDSEFVYWLKISDLDKNSKILLGCVYVPPEGSKYSTDDIFNEIENEFSVLLENDMHLALIGDFNARTSTKSDYIVPNDDLVEILNIDGAGVIDDFLYSHQKLLFHNIPLERVSEDKGKCNSHGSKLLSMCKNNNVFICNGRAGDDKGVGRVTSNQTSLIDYLILSPDLFPFVSKFRVNDFDPLISDVHCRLHVTLSTSIHETAHLHNNTHVNTTECIPKKWNLNMKDQFVLNVENKITAEDVLEKLNLLDIESQSFKTDLNSFVEMFSTIFTTSASESFGEKSRRGKNLYSNKKQFQPWFDHSCHQKRREFHDAKRKNSRLKTDESRAELKFCSKAYKTVMGKAFSDYQFRVENDLRNTADSEPRELWRILNNLSRSKQKDCDISINDLYEYFRDLNIDNDKSEDDNFELPDCNNDVVNDILNCEISEDEILIAVKKLKNNKAPGFDHIVNEYIKSTSTLLLPLYKKLFNMILDSSIIPQIWTVGIIMPIYKKRVTL